MRVFIAVEISKTQILNNVQKFQEDVKIDAKPIRIDQVHFTLPVCFKTLISCMERIPSIIMIS